MGEATLTESSLQRIGFVREQERLLAERQDEIGKLAEQLRLTEHKLDETGSFRSPPVAARTRTYYSALSKS